MGKKKDRKKANEDFIRGLQSGAYGPGKDARDQLKRFGVEGTRSVKPDNRGYRPHGQDHREIGDVKDDLQEAMMNDYDFRRGIEAAAMAGNKDARRYAKRGVKKSNLADAYNVLKDLKKEHVGGGGMRGPENEAGLTYALVQHERDVFNESIDKRIADATEGTAEDSIENTVEPERPSRHLAQAQALVDVYKQDVIGKYLDIYKPTADQESIDTLRDAYKGTYERDLNLSGAQGMANIYKDNLKESLKPA